MNNKLKKTLIGIIAFLITFFACYKTVFNFDQAIVVALIVLMAYWWIAKPVHIAVVAMLPVLVNAIFNIVPMGTVLGSYSSTVVVLLFGANVLTLIWTLSGLDKRIALKSLAVLGTSVKGQLVVWFVFATLLSTVISNAVVAATLSPIAISMVKYCSDDNEHGNDSIKYWILIAIAWGAGLGGFGTPLGGAMNLVAISSIEAFTGVEYMFIDWVKAMAPWLLLVMATGCVYFLSIKPDKKRLNGSKQYFKQEYLKMSKISRSEILALGLFLFSIILAFSRPLYKDIFPQFGVAYGFLISAILAFFIKGDDKKPLITWDYAAKNLNFGLMILFAGGLAIGKLLVDSGAAIVIAELVTGIGFIGAIGLLAILALIGMMLANTSSNTAACAVLIPVVISTAVGLNLDVMRFAHATAVACNCAFIFPTSIRSIPVAHGLDSKFMFKKGFLINGMMLIVLVLAGSAYII